MNRLLVVVAAMMLLVAGCDSVTVEQVQGLADKVETLNQVLDQYQAQTITTLNDLKAQGKATDADIEKAVKVNEEVDKVQADVSTMATAIKSVQLTGDKVQDILNVAKAANATTAPYNPYAPLIDVGLGLAAAISALLWRKKASDASEAQAKYNAHKAGVEAAKLSLTADPTIAGAAAAELIYSKIGEKRADMGIN